MAVLRVIADGTKGNAGLCIKSVAELAARAGVCHRLAQYAVRLAEREGLLTVQERRQKGAPNLVNIVRIVCADWLTWLKARRVQKFAPHDQKVSMKRQKEGWSRSLRSALGAFKGFEQRPKGVG